MGTTRKRQQRNAGGTPSPWAIEFLKNGKEPKKGAPGYEEWCMWHLFAGTTVPGLPTYNEIDTAKKRKIWKLKNEKG